jgi:hypothetical protein
MTAACTTRYSYLFDPPVGELLTAEDRSRYELAAILCATCPILEACATNPTAARSIGFRHGELWIKPTKDHRMRRVDLGRNSVRTPRTLRPRSTLPKKRCARCDRTKPADQFGQDATRLDGMNVYCLDCCTERRRERRERRAA